MITYKKSYKALNLNNNQVILDIETTGLDPEYDNLVLLGLIFIENDKSYIYQCFAEDDSEEIRLLNIFLEKTRDKEIINFNGDKFDIPFLNIKLMHYGLEPIFPESIDLLKVISSKRKFFEFESLRLMDLEKYVGINREDPSRYKVISKLTDDILKRENPWPIMIHNENDLIATEKLANASGYFRDKLSIAVFDNTLYLDSIWINNDIAEIKLSSKYPIDESYFAGNNYELKISNNDIEINLHVLYGMFDKDHKGHVALNTFGLENKTNIDIDPNLLIIRVNSTYNYKNILNLCKKIIENHL